VAELKARISEYLEQLPEGPLVITRHGRPTALVIQVPVDPDDFQSLLLSFSPKFWEIIDQSRKTKRIPFDEFWQKVDKTRTARRRRRPT
jgi:antitoxin (DNA-binding transcriptional repressor) of toxin-antitoxin stability system